VSPKPPDEHLSGIETRWTWVIQASESTGDEALRAQIKLWNRYAGAIQRYLARVAEDPDVAEDLAQEFTLRLIRGDFREADPERGRFRDLIKRAAINLVRDHQRRRRRAARPLDDLAGQIADPEETNTDDQLDRAFLQSWREALLASTWRRLEAFSQKLDHPYDRVLKLRVAEPTLRSAEMAERLSAELGLNVNAGWVRQNLARARARFIRDLLDQVAETLCGETGEALDDELIQLRLYEQCREGLAAFREEHRRSRK
jgi:RNA polymerase sigma-70 factor (ECF subfamily)